MTVVSIRKERKNTWKRPCEGGRDCNDASANQELCHHQKLGREAWVRFPLAALRRNQSCCHLAFSTVRQYISDVLSHIVCGTLLEALGKEYNRNEHACGFYI